MFEFGDNTCLLKKKKFKESCFFHWGKNFWKYEQDRPKIFLMFFNKVDWMPNFQLFQILTYLLIFPNDLKIFRITFSFFMGGVCSLKILPTRPLLRFVKALNLVLTDNMTKENQAKNPMTLSPKKSSTVTSTILLVLILNPYNIPENFNRDQSHLLG